MKKLFIALLPLVYSETQCPDGSQPQCVSSINSTSQAGTCPSACDPLANRCDPTTAPTCIYPDPYVASPRGACACRPGFKADGNSWDTSKQWRLPVWGQEYRVWVSEGVGCNTPCDVSSGTGSCREVPLVAEECIGTSASIPLKVETKPENTQCQQGLPEFPVPMYYGNTTAPVDADYNQTISMEVTTMEDNEHMATYELRDQDALGDHTVTIPIMRTSGNTSSNSANGTHSKYSNETTMLGPEQGSISYTLTEVLKQAGLSDKDTKTLVDAVAPVFAQIGPALLRLDYTFVANSTESNSTSVEASSSTAPTLEKRKKKKSKGFFQQVSSELGRVGEQLKEVLEPPPVKAIIHKIEEGISDLGKTDAVCTTLTSAALAGYLAVSTSAEVRALGPGHAMSHDQMFFLYPIYNDYPITEDLRVNYNFRATAPEAQQYGAMTFGRNMYIIAGEALEGPKWDPQIGSGDFAETTRTLIHEIRHTLQYRSHGWSKASFGLEYLRQWCKSGWHYNKIPYEVEAAAIEPFVNYFLDEEIGYSFFEFWKAYNLRYTLGYPTQRRAQITPGSDGSSEQFEVQFQTGALQHWKYQGEHCFLVLDSNDLIYRQLSTLCANSGNQASWCPVMNERWNRKRWERYNCLPKY